MTGISSLALLFVSWRSRLELNHSKPGFRGCLGVVFLSTFLVATDVRIIPGGPFSIHANLLPAICCLAMSGFAVRAFRADSTARRVGLMFIILSSGCIVALVVVDVVSFWRDRFARGALFGW